MNARVLFVSGSGDLLGGSELCLLELAPALRRSGWAPLVVVPVEGALAAALRAQGVDVLVTGLGSLRHRGEARSPIVAVRVAQAVLAALRLRSIIRRQGIELVHSNNSPVIAGALAARMAGVPHVWHVRENLHGPLWRGLRRMILALSDRVVCISESVAENLSPGRRPAVVHVIPDGIDLELFAPPTGPRAPSTVVMLARIHPEKGHDLFLRAASRVAASFPDCGFEMIGGCLSTYEGLRQDLEAMVDRLALRDRARFRDALDKEGVAAVLRMATVVVVPSRIVEGGGLVVLEAMATGAPVVATNQGGPAEIIRDGVDGFLVSPSDPAEMAGVIERLLRDPALRAEVGDKARRRTEENYSFDRLVDRLSSVYEEMVGTRVAL